MSVISFAEEFSRLILRYTKTTNDDQLAPDSQNSLKPLTKEEVASTISTVLGALNMTTTRNIDSHEMESTDMESILDNSLADSSVNTTVMLTASVTQTGHNDSAYRSSLSNEHASNLDCSSRSSLGVNETEAMTTSLNNLRIGDKINPASRSNPMIRVNIGRSDTFVCEKDQKVTIDEDDVFANISIIETNNLLHESFMESFNQVRKAILQVATKLDKLEEKIYLQSTKQRQHSHKSNSSFDINKSISIKTNLPVALRRSSSTFSGTSTTVSKLRAVGKENKPDRRRSVSNVSAVKTEKLNKSAKVSSMSSLNLPVCDKAPLTSAPRLVKNSRYAHVQSTIPKPGRVNNRKA